MRLSGTQADALRELLSRLGKLEGGFYRNKLGGRGIGHDDPQSDFEALPFTSKEELRDTYPLGIAAVPEREIVRIHSSSGTTGTPIIIPYTRKDVDDWAVMFKRCYEMGGVTPDDRVHVTPGYGLWTAGIGFQLGAELLGAMVIPMGPGNTEKQLAMMMDMKSTVLTATSSFALLLAEEIKKRGIKDKIYLKKGIIGSERWGEKMRRRIASELGVKLYDIYGLTEIYGPGIGMSCEFECGMHCWDDYMYFEIIDPKTGNNLPDGEIGELVITTLAKEGAPLIRYRTRDLTRIIPGKCECGSPYPRIDTLIGRTDDMVKVKGVNIYPGQIEDVLRDIDGVSSEYQVMIDHLDGKDIMTLFFETELGASKRGAENAVKAAVKSRIGITVVPMGVAIGELPRSEKKTTRIFDNRY
ncbi:MAG: phenylacetate--CoA ligase [Oscillospiraceae bacterium]|jgi:phenylacetate-CoA ligase|nr:phenylacetate--CoA ligase [Oscillospiraceae bacterium]